MNDKLTYEELENQIAELKKQNEILRLNSVFQNGEKGKRAEELILANIELDFQNQEKDKRAAELIIANIELAFQDKEKQKRAAELISANIKLALQSKENEKLASELIIANFALSLQDEIIIAKEKAEESERNLKLINEEFITTNEELRQTNDELFIAKDKAEESEKLKTAFLQNMSHEIRTPMNSIIGFSKMLDKPELSPEKRKSFVSIIVNSTNQLLSIVTDILTISSLETKQTKVDIKALCINNLTVDFLAIFKTQAFNQNISLYAKQQLTDRQSEIYTDITKITQILSNLLTNALKFTHEGFIEFGYNLKDEFLEFYVKDSGIGIKTEMQEKIFERFRQANENINMKYGGSGLGLAISKAFTELLGGKIWVHSELDKGSTFYFTIPYKPVHEIDKTNSPTVQNENFPTVLVAEDEECNFLLIEELLSDMDLKLIHAKDGKETVEICRTNPKIDLILMDIKMPIMTGHEAAKLIKEFRPDLIIIAQSAYGLEQEIEKYSGVFDDYVTKPIDEDDLKQKLMKYVAKSKSI